MVIRGPSPSGSPACSKEGGDIGGRGLLRKVRGQTERDVSLLPAQPGSGSLTPALTWLIAELGPGDHRRFRPCGHWGQAVPRWLCGHQASTVSPK